MHPIDMGCNMEPFGSFWARIQWTFWLLHVRSCSVRPPYKYIAGFLFSDMATGHWEKGLLFPIQTLFPACPAHPVKLCEKFKIPFLLLSAAVWTCARNEMHTPSNMDDTAESHD